MQFTRLRLAGFKSFVDPVDIEIARGLTGVVGPNGCGKSNLVEALCWVMGESTASHLRGGELEDVIFTGSERRPEHGFAEVALGIDNTSRSVPGRLNAYSELTIARRIERSKGSVYRVNGEEMRAREVRLLFDDAGTGSRSASIIAQGRISALVNASPGDRRMLLEQAAQIRGLRARRREALARLAHAEANLERVADLLEALRARLAGVERQAGQARRYRRLSQAIRDAEAGLLHREWLDAETEREDRKNRCRAAEAAVRSTAAASAQADAHRANHAARLPALREGAVQAAGRAQEVELARRSVDDEFARLRRDRAEAEARLRQVSDDLEREKGLEQEALAVLARMRDEEQALGAAGQDEHTGLACAGQAIASAEQRVTAAQRNLSELDALITGTDARRELLERQHRSAGERAGRLAEERAVLSGRRGEALRAARGTEQACEAGRAVERAERALEQAGSEAEAAETARLTSSAALEAATAALGDINAESARLGAEAESLRCLLGPEFPKEPVLDRLEVAAGYEIALGAALGDDLSAPLVKDTTNGAARGWADRSAPVAAPALPHGALPLGEMVNGAGRLDARLSQIGVVPDVDAAGALQHRLSPGQRLTTPAGGLWRWDGYFEAASHETATGVRIRNRARLAELEQGGAQLAIRRAEAEAARAKAGRAHELAVARETAGRTTLREARRTLEAARSLEARLRTAGAEAAATAAALEQTIARLAAQQAEAQDDSEAAAAEIASLEDLSARREERQRLGRDHDACLAALAEARQHRDRLGQEAEERLRRRRELGSEIAAWTERREQARARTDELAVRREETAGRLRDLETLPAEIAARRTRLDARVAAAHAARDQADQALSDSEAVLGDADRAVRQAEQSALAAREEQMRGAAALEQAEHVIAVLRRQIIDRLELTPEDLCATLADEGQEEDVDTIRTRLERLRQQRERLGPVNLRAEIESREIREEIESLENECADLTGAITRLREAVRSLDRVGRQRLRDAFEVIDGHFRRVFSRLFGGGSAHLVWMETEDPLSPGLDVVASPPGKSGRRLSLLSGGEQALTSLSLVFATFLTAPAPVCVLDEVDAPLDDRNVERFCDLLDEVVRESGTRFLVITHHRLTMARMDRLYGVTMTERGVSRLVSVDLDQAENVRRSVA